MKRLEISTILACVCFLILSCVNSKKEAAGDPNRAPATKKVSFEPDSPKTIEFKPAVAVFDANSAKKKISLTTNAEEGAGPKKPTEDSSKISSNRKIFSIADGQKIVSAITAMQNECNKKEHSFLHKRNPEMKGGLFDVNDYFKALKHLSLAPGHVLDYVYDWDGMAGHPVVYSRKATAPRFNSILALRADFPYRGPMPLYPQTDTYLSAVKADGTPDSYFEIAVLRQIGSRFYIYWHAFYAETIVICNQDAGKEYFSEEVRDQARRIDFTPKVTVDGKKAVVRYFFYSPWGGIFHSTVEMNRSFPHAPVEEEKKCVVPYWSRVMF